MPPQDDALAARAISWARTHLGSTAYATRCLAFVEDAIERSNDIEIFGGDDAAESARLYEASLRHGLPPAGALVFYDSVGEWYGDRRNWGHVALSLGDDTVVHAWDVVRVDDYRAIEQLQPAPGWEPPRLLGWVPLERVLHGSRSKRYDADEDPAATATRMQAERFARDDT